jgi:hypothetical protein
LLQGEPLLSRTGESHGVSLFCPAKRAPLPCPDGFSGRYDVRLARRALLPEVRKGVRLFSQAEVPRP